MVTDKRRRAIDELLRAWDAGREQAELFRRLGFDQEHAEQLRKALLDLARTTDMSEEVTQFGEKYTGTGRLRSPSGKDVPLVTVWILPGGLPPPVLVTAYPG